ncbi:hypothetical protein RGQ29_014683 [Quercus rubra]|uniref:Bet v I/Major latex protein domain-containing protein n=1 Tax=Quercus rubra TaxID=3512 RepID=A0AAN7FM17_QUERU|nr:hypothetical protein RGQ29_014683 [Quercus rubra]
MAQIASMDFQTEIKCPAEKFFNFFRTKAQLVPSTCPSVIKDVQLLKGDWETEGSVNLWRLKLTPLYLKEEFCPILKPAVKIHNIGNNIETLKETVKAIDEQNKSISFKMLDGELLDTMKNMKSNMQVSTKGDQSLVKWTIEYENANQELPARYLDFLPGWTKAIEAYLLNA